MTERTSLRGRAKPKARAKPNGVAKRAGGSRAKAQAQAAPPASGGILHPFTRALYERIDAQRVRVTLGAQSGVFAPDGRWLEGELREADPQLCGWLGGPRMIHHRLQVPASH